MTRKRTEHQSSEVKKLYAGVGKRTRSESQIRMTLPGTVRDLVCAYVADYERRNREIRAERIPGELRDYFLWVNCSIDTAMLNCEQTVRHTLLDDIAMCRGYDKSQAHTCMSRKMYYQQKNIAEVSIARELRLYG